MAIEYNIKKIKTLLINGFDLEELLEFCKMDKQFKSVHTRIPQNATTEDVATRLISYAEQRVLLPKLLDWAREENPYRYEEHHPYHTMVVENDEAIDKILIQQPFVIVYNTFDGDIFALTLYEALKKANIPVWLHWEDINQNESGRDVRKVLQHCRALLFVMTPKSIASDSKCSPYWEWALSFKKRIIPLRLQSELRLPPLIADRKIIDFEANFKRGWPKLQKYLANLDSLDSALEALKERYRDAERDLNSSQDPLERKRIISEMSSLEEEIAAYEKVVRNPKGAAKKNKRDLARAIRLERQSPNTPQDTAHTIVRNALPTAMPVHFQGREAETERVITFLSSDTANLLIITGRGGIGKTTLVYRLLKTVADTGHLPDEADPLPLEAIIYLTPRGGQPLDASVIFSNLLTLLPDAEAERLQNQIKGNPSNVAANTRALLAAFPQTPPTDEAQKSKPVVLFLDNLEDIIDSKSEAITAPDLTQALQTILQADSHRLKVIITSRIRPQPLASLPSTAAT